MNQTQRIRLGLLLTNLKLGGRFSFRTFTADASYPKDPDPKNWRTINGSKVHLTNGKIDGGAGGKFKGNPWLGKKPHGHNSFFPPKGWVKKEPEPEPVPEPENESVPFGSPAPAPAPSTASEKPPIGIINTMKGTFKNSSKEVQTDVSNFLKSGDINELPVFPNGVDMLNDELCQKAYNAWKNKMITKTAAQNIVAKAVGTPNSYIVKLAAESWGDVPAAPAKTKTAKPEASKPTTPPASTMPKSDADAKAKEIISKMDSSPEHDHDTILEEAGLSSKEKEAVMLDYEMDMMNGSNNAEKTLGKILSKKDETTAGQPSAPTVSYNDLTSSEKDEIKFAKLAVENGFSPEDIGALHLNNPKKEFAEMAVALIEDYNDNPTAEKQKNLHDKLAQIMKGQYKASKEDLSVYKSWKNPSSQWGTPPTIVKGMLNSMNEYDPSTGEGESIKEFVDALKNDDESPDTADQYLWVDPQSKGMELAVETAKAFKAGDLTEGQALQAFSLVMSNNLGEIENLIEKWYTASPSAKALNFNPYDFSEKAVGWKLPENTQMSFKSDNSADFKQYKQKNAAACKKMTKNQTAGIWRYTAGSTHLRDWLVYGQTDDWYKDGGNESTYKKLGVTNPYKNGMTGAALQKVADDISAGLKKIGHEDIIVNRNCSLMDWATPDNPNGVTFSTLQKMAKTGEVFENKAFLSATPLENSVYGNSQARRHIFVPKKANGGFIDSVSEYKDQENEFLLDKNTKTRIIKVEKDKIGTIHVYEEVVLDD